MKVQVRAPIAFLLGASALVLGVAWCGARFAKAEASLESAERALVDVRTQAREILELRSKRARLEQSSRPKQDVIAQVGAALVEAGLPASALRELEREGDVAVSDSGGAKLRKQSLRVALEPMDLAAFGTFLAAFRRAQPAWVPTRIDLAHAKGAGRPDVYAPRLLLSALYVGEAPAGAR